MKLRLREDQAKHGLFKRFEGRGGRKITGRCPAHDRASLHFSPRCFKGLKTRGTTSQRGYGPKHQKFRAQWARVVRLGGVSCVRCGQPINPEEPWDLGHDDFDRTRYTGPEHVRCNRSTSGRKRNSRRW